MAFRDEINGRVYPREIGRISDLWHSISNSLSYGMVKSIWQYSCCGSISGLDFNIPVCAREALAVIERYAIGFSRAVYPS